MQSPPIPDDEASRLTRLYSLGLLDQPPDERFDAVVRIAKRLFDVPIALVSLVDTNRQWFAANIGLSPCETTREVSFCGHTIVSEEPFVIPDAREDPRFSDNPLVTGPPNIVFYAGVPLRIEPGSGLGTLCIIDHRPRDIGEDLQYLKDLANMLVTHFQTDRRANTDPLTGLLNRRGLEIASESLLSLCDRQDTSATMFYIDLDRFKAINDTWGHQAGDDALYEMSRLLRSTFRRSDVITRLGGDEFGVVCANVGADEVRTLRDRLANAVEQANQGRGRGWSLEYTVGHVVRKPRSTEDCRALVARADAMMLERKRFKRERREQDTTLTYT